MSESIGLRILLRADGSVPGESGGKSGNVEAAMLKCVQ
jgi:hypothetical protein